MKRLIISMLFCGAVCSCTQEDLSLAQTTTFDETTTTRSEISEAEIDYAIAQIVEDKLSQYQSEDYMNAYWGTVVIMDVESGYTRIINCCANDDKIGDADINYAEQPLYQGSAFLPIPFLSLLDEGGMKPTDPVDINYSRKRIGGILVADSHIMDATTFSEAFIQGSNMAIVQGCYDNLNLPGDDLYRAMGYDEELSPVKMLRAYNMIANGGKYVDIKYDRDEPTIVLEEAMFSQDAIAECKRCMVQHALDRKLERVATYNGVALVPDEQGRWNTWLYTMTNVGFFPIDNPKYTVLVSFRTRYINWALSVHVLPAIIEELSKED
ncbi:MAG: penicillin-binding transpeptidase domain-containing protein [Rikenellaceae bacterium]